MPRHGQNDGVTEIEAAGGGLLPGTTVRAVVTRHEDWGVRVAIRGLEQLAASVDASAMDAAEPGRAPAGEFPPVGAELDMVVTELRGAVPPGSVRLSLRAADLAGLRLPCDLCGDAALLSPDGDGLTLEVRGTGGPLRAGLTVHRGCLAQRLHESSLERPRVAAAGTAPA